MIKTQILSASRAGLRTAVVSTPGPDKTQVLSDLGVVMSSIASGTAGGGAFVIHPFV